MRPSKRFASKKKVRTPGARVVQHFVAKRSKAHCGICHTPLLGTRRARSNPEFCAPCSRRMLTEKVTIHAKEG